MERRKQKRKDSMLKIFYPESIAKKEKAHG